MTRPNPRTDRHSNNSVQFKVWVPINLRSSFNRACQVAGLTPSDVVRSLLSNFNQIVMVQASIEEVQRG